MALKSRVFQVSEFSTNVAFYSRPYGLEIESMPDEGTTIRIHLPYIPYEPEKLELLENGKMQELKGGKSNEEK